MAQRQLWLNRRAAINWSGASIILPILGCSHIEPSLGIALGFYNKGSHPLATKRFDFDGKQGPVPGYLGPSLKNGKHMGFMLGDRKGGIPQSVEVEWILHSKEYSAWSNSTPNSEIYSKENQEIYKKLWAANPHYIKRVDLTAILTPDIVAKVLADRENNQLKMTIIFRDDKVDITAEPYKWR